MSTHQPVVIVTGGSRGLGLAIVEDLLESGYRVATCSRGSSPAMERLSARCDNHRFMWHPCTLGVEAEEESFFKSATAWTGADGLYALVNNAAIAGAGVMATLPTADIERIMQVNLLGAMRLARLALRVLLAQARPGRVVNISSIAGSRGYSGLAAYAASKAGLDGLSRALAREVGRRGITVNSIAPGYLETELSAALNDQQRGQIVSRTPLGRLGTVQDVAAVVAFLLSERAAFITGQTLVVDGGLSC